MRPLYYVPFINEKINASPLLIICRAMTERISSMAVMTATHCMAVMATIHSTATPVWTSCMPPESWVSRFRVRF
jgi:hypothetical protein